VGAKDKEKTNVKATAPVPADILGGECIRAADQCACRLAEPGSGEAVSFAVIIIIDEPRAVT
jgi:hypothetical protein